jgi:hypothetical protein
MQPPLKSPRFEYPHFGRMVRRTIPKPWGVADVPFVEIAHRTDPQLRGEFDCGRCVVIAAERQIPVAARLIERLRARKWAHE